MAVKFTSERQAALSAEYGFPTVDAAQQALNRLLLYWCSSELADALWTRCVLQELSTLPFLQGISRIVIASSPEGKKTRKLKNFFEHVGLRRPGNVPFEFRACDLEGVVVERPKEGVYIEIFDEETERMLYKPIEPSTNAACVVVNAKLAAAVQQLLGKEGGASLVIANDLTVFIGSEADGFVRLANPERMYAAEKARGGKFTWKVIMDALDKIAALIAHEKGMPAKTAYVLYHFVIGFSRQTIGPGPVEDVIHNIGWSFKVGIHGVEKAVLERDLEKARQDNTVSAMLKRPPLVPFAEKYTPYMQSIDIIPFLLRPDLTDDVGQAHTHPDTGNIIDPGYADVRFVRPQIFAEGETVQVQDVFGVKHLVEDWQQAGRLFEQQQQIFSQILKEVMEFMIAGVPPHGVLLNILATLAAPTSGNTQEVTVVGYPELLQEVPGETTQEKRIKARQALVTIKTPTKRWANGKR